MKIAVLGGAGFIGQHLVRALETMVDIESRVFDKLTGRFMPTQNPVAPGEIIEMQLGPSNSVDLTAVKDWQSIVAYRPDVIVNLIARLADRDTAIVVLRMADVLLAGLREGWVPHVVHLSSAAVYGNLNSWAGDDWHSHKEGPGAIVRITRNVSLYGLDKQVAEYYMEYLCDRGIPITILRPANVYGPGQGGNVFDLFARRLKAGEPPIINTSAAVTRDFVHVDDVVAAIVAAIEKPPGYGQLRVYNVGTGLETTLGELADMMRGHLGGPRFLVDTQRPCGIRRSALDCGRIKEELGWEPEQVVLAEGLERTLRAEGFLAAIGGSKDVLLRNG